MLDITDQEFKQFQNFIFEASGITLPDVKKTLVKGRLSKRLQHHQLKSFSDYYRMITGVNGAAEAQIAIDLLTTNETYFFREMKHFDWLKEQAQNFKTSREQMFRVWSAASSTGEEAYSISMVLMDCLEFRQWEVLGSDISSRVLQRAKQGHYPDERTEHIPDTYLKRFCLKGTAEYGGTLLIKKEVQDRVKFLQINLNEKLPSVGQFDVVFLRNVMIYFSNDTKQKVVQRIASVIKPGGYLFIGHSESLHNITDIVKPVAPAIYIKP